MAINKVIYGGTTLIDLSGDSLASADQLMQGVTAHDRTGALITGTATGGSGSGAVWQDAQGYVHLSDEGDIELQTKTVSPTESAQTVLADAGYYALDRVNVNAIPSNYVGSGITQRTSSDLTVSGATVTAPAGYYGSDATKTISSGSVSSPLATKGSVSNHSISVTPSVTNTTGYITGGTKSGTAVTVSASELVSGTKSITENGTGIDVTNYAAVDVAVSGGGGSDYTLVASKTYTVSTTSTTSIDIGTFETGATSLWTSDAMVYVKIRDTAGQRNGYFYGCDAFIYNYAPYYNPTGTTSLTICGNMYVGQSTGYLTSPIALVRSSSGAAVTGYGIYPTRLYDNGDIAMSARYSTTSTTRTGTIDGTFSVEVYLLKWPNNIPPYQG